MPSAEERRAALAGQMADLADLLTDVLADSDPELRALAGQAAAQAAQLREHAYAERHAEADEQAAALRGTVAKLRLALGYGARGGVTEVGGKRGMYVRRGREAPP